MDPALPFFRTLPLSLTHGRMMAAIVEQRFSLLHSTTERTSQQAKAMLHSGLVRLLSLVLRIEANVQNVTADQAA